MGETIGLRMLRPPPGDDCIGYIYKIENDINSKVYIGATNNDPYERFAQHCRELRKDRCKHRSLYKAMREYGVEHFKVTIIEQTDDLNVRETYWINQYNSFAEGYNDTYGGLGKQYTDINQVTQLYQKRKNCRVVADEIGVSYDAVRKALKKRNVDIVQA